MKPRPLIFLGFSNAEGAYLESLKMESAALFNALYPLEEQGQVHIAREESMDTAELFQALRRYKDSMTIFHFAGHAGSDLLQLEDSPVSASGIADLLKAQADTIRLVFLNGCATRQQVAKLHACGISAVIATSRAVDDTKARFFAERFYTALADGTHTLLQAFERAKTELEEAYHQPSNLHRGILQPGSTGDHFEWGLYAQSENGEDLHWKLSDPFMPISQLRKASAQRLQTLRESTFRYLQIEDALRSPEQGRAEDKPLIPIHVQYSGEKRELHEAVEQLWTTPDIHTLLIGAGGMGKTVSMVHLWTYFLEKPKAPGEEVPVPLYLALEEINDWQGNRRGHFLEEQLQQYYQIYDFRDLLGVENTQYAPRIILLLDGINGVNAEWLPVLLEDIGQWANTPAFPNLQIILTTQKEEKATFPDTPWATCFHRLELQPLSDKDIREYLGQGTILSTELLELLRNPMMLALFRASRYQKESTRFLEDITQSGELLFNVEQLNRANIEERHKNKPQEVVFQRFILEHLLPCIGWNLYQMNTYAISAKEPGTQHLRELLHRELPNLIHEDFFDTFDRDYDRYLDERRFDLPPRQLFNQVIREVCVEKLVLLVEENTSFRFLHNLFRDYMAARHILNQVELSIRTSTLPPLLKSVLLKPELCQMIGQLEGEHRFNPGRTAPAPLVWMNRQRSNRLQKLLELCRGNFSAAEIGYVLQNVLQIIAMNRGELAQTDLQLLDLRKVNLNGVRLCRWEKKTIHAHFFGALVHPQTFLGEAKPLAIAYTQRSKDKKRVVFASAEGEVQEWHIASATCIRAQTTGLPLSNIRYSNSGRSLYLFASGAVYTWPLYQEYPPLARPDHAFSPDDVYIETEGYTPAEKRKLTRIQPVKGCFFQGLDLSNLHPSSTLAPDTIEILRAHGALFSEKDRKLRGTFLEKYFQLSSPLPGDAGTSDPSLQENNG